MTAPTYGTDGRCTDCGRITGHADSCAYHYGAPRAYNIVRFYRDAAIRRRVIRERVTLTEAQAHCSDPETSSSTATGKTARARTRRVGPWFDGYEAR